MDDDTRVSPDEKERINFEIALIGKMIEAREEKGLSQRELAEISGVKQPAIARLESLKATPQIDTLLKFCIRSATRLKSFLLPRTSSGSLVGLERAYGDPETSGNIDSRITCWAHHTALASRFSEVPTNSNIDG
jgi:transcriptional regulator with XRE-family HTH domain